MNGVLLRAGLPEIAIKKAKPRYLRALRQADDGDLGPLEALISDGLFETQQKSYQIRFRKQAELVKRRHSQHGRN